jgi:hypothetical protein
MDQLIVRFAAQDGCTPAQWRARAIQAAVAARQAQATDPYVSTAS